MLQKSSELTIDDAMPSAKAKLTLWAWIMQYWESVVLATVLLAILTLLLLILFPAPEQVLSLQNVPLSKPVPLPSALPLETSDLLSEDSAFEEPLSPVGSSAHTAAKKHTHHYAHKKPKHPPITSLNKASLAQLQLLPGIGPKMAQRVMEYRKSHGSFTDVAQVMDVKGIGPKKFEKMKLFLKL